MVIYRHSPNCFTKVILGVMGRATSSHAVIQSLPQYHDHILSKNILTVRNHNLVGSAAEVQGCSSHVVGRVLCVEGSLRFSF